VCLLASIDTVSATAVTFTSITLSTAAAGASVTATVAFTVATQVANTGSITLNMPMGYFIGSVSGVTGVNSLQVSQATAASKSSTSIALATSGAVIPTGAQTLTFTGLSNGGARPATADGFTLKTSTDQDLSGAKEAAAVTGAITFTSITVGSTAQGATVTPVLVFNPAIDLIAGGTITLTMPVGYFRGTVSSIASSKSGLTATSTPAADSSSTTIILTTGGAATGTGTAITMTLTGLTLGTVQTATTAGFQIKSSATNDIISIGLDAAAITGMQFNTITLASSTAGASVSPVLQFHPATTISIGGTITLTMPAGYFRGTVSSITNTVDAFKATSSVAATATSTSIVLTTSDSPSGASQRTITLIGLTLGGARAQVTAGFQLSSSNDTGLSAGLNASAVTGMVLTSVTMGATSSGASVSPVLVFTPHTSVSSGGTIILTMPAGYFLGSVHSIASSVTSLNATGSFYGSPAISNSTAIVLTTSGAATSTAAVTMTLYGLTLGSARAAVTAGLQLSSSADAGLSFGVNAPEITAAAAITAAPSSTKSSGMMIQVSGLVLFVLAALICY